MTNGLKILANAIIIFSIFIFIFALLVSISNHVNPLRCLVIVPLLVYGLILERMVSGKFDNTPHFIRLKWFMISTIIAPIVMGTTALIISLFFISKKNWDILLVIGAGTEIVTVTLCFIIDVYLAILCYKESNNR